MVVLSHRGIGGKFYVACGQPGLYICKESHELPSRVIMFREPHTLTIHALQSKLLKGGYIEDYIGDLWGLLGRYSEFRL